MNAIQPRSWMLRRRDRAAAGEPTRHCSTTWRGCPWCSSSSSIPVTGWIASWTASAVSISTTPMPSGFATQAAFAEITAETIVDLFELEFGSSSGWWTGGMPLCPEPLPLSWRSTRRAARRGAGASCSIAPTWFQHRRRASAQVATCCGSEMISPLLAGVGAAQARRGVPAAVPAGRLAWIIGGITEGRADFYSGIDRRSESFTVFAQQAARCCRTGLTSPPSRRRWNSCMCSDEERLNLALEAAMSVSGTGRSVPTGVLLRPLEGAARLSSGRDRRRLLGVAVAYPSGRRRALQQRASDYLAGRLHRVRERPPASAQGRALCLDSGAGAALRDR
jgi:hypothetical protein